MKYQIVKKIVLPMVLFFGFVLGTSFASSHYEGEWSGTTDQGYDISFTIKYFEEPVGSMPVGDAITRIVVKLEYCNVRSTRSFSQDNPISTDTFTIDIDENISITGTFATSSECSGTWSATRNGCSDTGTWSAEKEMDAVDKITLVSPSGTIETPTPTFQWNEDPASTWYYLIVWDSSDEKVHARWYETEDITSDGLCSITLSSELPDDTYQWWVRGWNDIGNGPWSDGSSFTISSSALGPPAAVSLVSPGGSVSNPVVFTWNAVSNATWYQVWVNDDAGNTVKKQWVRAENSNCGSGNGTCAITAESQELNTGNYKWWVRGWNEEGNGDWSSAMNFSLGSTDGKPAAALLISPTGTANDTVAYTWNAVINSTRYYLWVDDETGTQVKEWVTPEQAGCESGTGSCSVTPSTPSALVGDCRWWIQTYNDGGYGPWSQGVSFTIQNENPTNTYAGHYKGTYSGDYSGMWEITIDSSGNISGTGSNSSIEGYIFSVIGTINSTGALEFSTASGSTDEETSFSGSIDSKGKITGTWYHVYDQSQGVFSGQPS